MPTIRWIRSHFCTVLYVLCSLAVLAWIGVDAVSVRAITQSPGADFWEHAATVRALMDNPWDPGNPHLASSELSPRYHPLFWLVAVVGRVFTDNVLHVMGIASCLHIALFTGGVYCLASTLYRQAWAPLVMLAVLLCAWWQGWHYSNVYQLEILVRVASYPSTAALALSWFGFVAALRALEGGRRHLVALAGLCWLVFLVHPLTAVMTLVGVGAIVAFEPATSRRRRSLCCLAVVLGTALAHFWPFFSPFEVIAGGRGNEAGWIGRAVSGASRRRLHEFYHFRDLARAIGLALPGFYFAATLAAKRQRLFIPVGLILMFGVFVANAFVKVPLGHRFVLLGLVFLHLACVHGVVTVVDAAVTVGRTQAGRAWTMRVAAAGLVGLVVVGVVHNVRSASHRWGQDRRAGRSETLIRAQRVGRFVGSTAVVLAPTRDGWSLPAFGPKVVSLFHHNPLVGDRKRRTADVALFFRGASSARQRTEILRKYGVTHVLVPGRAARPVKAFLRARATAKRLPRGYRLYDLSTKNGSVAPPDS